MADTRDMGWCDRRMWSRVAMLLEPGLRQMHSRCRTCGAWGDFRINPRRARQRLHELVIVGHGQERTTRVNLTRLFRREDYVAMKHLDLWPPCPAADAPSGIRPPSTVAAPATEARE